MSKIGKKPIQIPTGVQVQIQGGLVTVKGPKGELHRTISDAFIITVEGDLLVIKPSQALSTRQDSANWGLYRALLRNMVIGVSAGFEEGLEFQGVGYKAVPKGADLELSLGFSHTILYQAPAGISFKVEKNSIKISGIDKEVVGKVAAEIRSKKTPEPYKGSGVRYSDEIIKKKAGKKAATA